MGIKLNLGCFNKKIPGFVNIDARSDVNPDLQDNIVTLENVQNNSVSLIYACHVCEHVSRADSFKAFRRWYEVLKPGGIVRIAVPNLERMFEHYMFYKDLRYLSHMLYGSQNYETYDFHLNGWDQKTLSEDLIDCGFENPRLYNRWETEHFRIDDYSAAYFPHMDFENGTLMSLNMEATKPNV